MADGQTQNQQSGLEKLHAQAEEYLNGWKRAKADLINYQKQVERERAEWFMYANAGCVKAMLPVVDALEAAVVQDVIASEAGSHAEGRSASGGQSHEIATAPSVPHDDTTMGLQRICDQMLEALKVMGVEAIPIAKEPANPELHEVVGIEKIEGVASGLMVREVQRGYTMHGKTLRPAKVIVAE